MSRPELFLTTGNCPAGNVVVVVVMVSMGLLVTVLAVGIVRLRAAAAAEQGDEQELELGWEGGREGPNITVNPLEVRTDQRQRQTKHPSSLQEC